MPKTTELNCHQNKENQDAMTKLLKGHHVGTKKCHPDQLDLTSDETIKTRDNRLLKMAKKCSNDSSH